MMMMMMINAFCAYLLYFKGPSLSPTDILSVFSKDLTLTWFTNECKQFKFHFQAWIFTKLLLFTKNKSQLPRVQVSNINRFTTISCKQLAISDHRTRHFKCMHHAEGYSALQQSRDILLICNIEIMIFSYGDKCVGLLNCFHIKAPRFFVRREI